MTQADSVHSTPPTNTPAMLMAQGDKHLATAYRRIENDICNLERMGTIADRLVGEWMESVTDARAAFANFAVQHLADMLRLFKKNYDADYTESRGGTL